MTKKNEATKESESQHQTYEIGIKGLVFHDDRLLLVQRRDYNKWEMPGGRINRGNTIQETLLRELSEELPGKWNFVVRDIVHAGQADFTLPNGNRLMLLSFYVESQPPSSVAISDEHQAVRWVLPDEFVTLGLQPHVHEAGMRGFAYHDRLRNSR